MKILLNFGDKQKLAMNDRPRKLKSQIKIKEYYNVKSNVK